LQPSQAVGPDSSKFGIDGSYTVIVVARCKRITNNFPFYFEGADGKRGISSHIPWSNGIIYFDNAGCCKSDT